MSRPIVYGEPSQPNVRSVLFALCEKEVLFRNEPRQKIEPNASGPVYGEAILDAGGFVVEGVETHTAIYRRRVLRSGAAAGRRARPGAHEPGPGTKLSRSGHDARITNCGPLSRRIPDRRVDRSGGDLKRHCRRASHRCSLRTDSRQRCVSGRQQIFDRRHRCRLVARLRHGDPAWRAHCSVRDSVPSLVGTRIRAERVQGDTARRPRSVRLSWPQLRGR